MNDSFESANWSSRTSEVQLLAIVLVVFDFFLFIMESIVKLIKNKKINLCALFDSKVLNIQNLKVNDAASLMQHF